MVRNFGFKEENHVSVMILEDAIWVSADLIKEHMDFKKSIYVGEDCSYAISLSFGFMHGYI